MSGHSKWAKIKHQKGANDAKKGVLFTKLAKNITMAAKDGGGDIGMNFALRLAVEKAKAVNMPSDNIDRAIKKAVGGDEKTIVQKVSYEAMKGNIGVIIDCSTDNVNRTFSEVKNAVEDSGWKLASTGSVSWNFNEVGYISLLPQRRVKAIKFGAEDTYENLNIDELELELMDISGINDIEKVDNDEDDMKFSFDIYTDKVKLKEIVDSLELKSYRIQEAKLIKISKDELDVDDKIKEDYDNLFDRINDLDDVDEVWSNIK